MAISKTAKTTTTIASLPNYPYTVKVTFTESSTSTSDNTSTIKITGTIGGSSASFSSSSNCTLTVYWHDNNSYTTDKSIAKVSFTSMASSATKTATGQITVPHKSDGTLSGYAIVKYVSGGNAYQPKSATVKTDTAALAEIPRATTPTLSASSINLGTSVTIKTPRASTSFEHKLKYSFGSASDTIASDVQTSKSWTPTLSLASQIPNATSGTCTITCETYKGSLIGTKKAYLTLKVPSSVVPTISNVTLKEANTDVSAVTDLYLKGLSRVLVNVTASGSYGSTIKKYSIKVDGNTYTTNGTSTGVFYTAGTKSIECSVTDSRGRTSAAFNTELVVYDYFKPIAKINNIYRCNADGTYNDEGTSVYIDYTTSYDTLNESYLSGSCKLFYKLSTDSTYTSRSLDNGSGNLILSGFNKDNSYEFYATTSDSFFDITSPIIEVDSSFSLIDFKASGTGIAIGKSSEYDYMVEIDDKFALQAYGKLNGIMSTTTDNQDGRHQIAIGWDGSKPTFQIDNETATTLANVIFCGMKPYYEAGDTIPIKVYTAGFVSSSSKRVYMSVTLDKPILGNPTATVSSNNGFILRQDGNYSFGSSSGTYIKPNAYNVDSVTNSTVTFYAEFSSTTNVINNDVVGINWSGYIKLT